jgi:D-aminoacyl-tRNA deacylase
MKCVIQRVKNASVTVNQIQLNQIDSGLLIYVGFHKDDELDKIDHAVEKILKLRIFDDEFGKMNLPINTKKDSVLLISQFTLYGSAKNSNRPSFSEAMPYVKAKEYYQLFLDKLNQQIKTNPGDFGSHMNIASINDGPVTILLDF